MAKPMVEIAGLKELRRDLLALDKEYFAKAMVEAGMSVAEPIASAIRGALPHKSGRLAGSVRVGKVRTGATIRTGTKAIPYGGPVEFGGYPRPAVLSARANRRGNVPASLLTGRYGGRPYQRGGRYIFPTAKAMTSAAEAKYSTAVEGAINRYPWYQPK